MKWFRDRYNSIKWFISNALEIVRVFRSPFVGLKFNVYWGNIQMGNPIFFPRKWVRMKEKPGYRKPVYLKYFGFDWNWLMWKTKYDDIRFEYAPSFSFVILGKQLWLQLLPKFASKHTNYAAVDCFWEAFLYYDTRTDKSKSKEDRLIEVFEQYSCTWTTHPPGQMKISNDYYYDILKPEYLDLYIAWKPMI